MVRTRKGRIRYSYTEKFELIKPYVEFEFKNPERVGTKNKRKISKYFQSITGLLSSGQQVKIFKSKKRLAIAKRSLNPELSKDLPDLKAVFLSPLQPKGTKVKFRKNKAFLQHEFGEEEYFDFDPVRLTKDPAKEVRRAVKNSGFKRFKIRAGEHTMSDSFSNLDLLIKEVEKLMNAYDSKAPTAGYLESRYKTKRQQQNHDYRRWLVGVEGIKTRNQSKRR